MALKFWYPNKTQAAILAELRHELRAVTKLMNEAEIGERPDLEDEVAQLRELLEWAETLPPEGITVTVMVDIPEILTTPLDELPLHERQRIS